MTENDTEHTVKCQYCKVRLNKEGVVTQDYALESHWLNECDQIPTERYDRLNNTYDTVADQ